MSTCRGCSWINPIVKLLKILKSCSRIPQPTLWVDVLCEKFVKHLWSNRIMKYTAKLIKIFNQIMTCNLADKNRSAEFLNGLPQVKTKVTQNKSKTSPEEINCIIALNSQNIAELGNMCSVNILIRLVKISMSLWNHRRKSNREQTFVSNEVKNLNKILEIMTYALVTLVNA